MGVLRQGIVATSPATILTELPADPAAAVQAIEDEIARLDPITRDASRTPADRRAATHEIEALAQLKSDVLDDERLVRRRAQGSSVLKAKGEVRGNSSDHGEAPHAAGSSILTLSFQSRRTKR